jgi:hypothetical protein
MLLERLKVRSSSILEPFVGAGGLIQSPNFDRCRRVWHGTTGQGAPAFRITVRYAFSLRVSSMSRPEQ